MDIAEKGVETAVEGFKLSHNGYKQFDAFMIKFTILYVDIFQMLQKHRSPGTYGDVLKTD